MDKPSILVFIDWYYPGFKAGGPVRSCLNMVEHLKNDFNFFIVTRNTEYTEEVPYADIEYNKWVNGPSEEKVMYLDLNHQNESFYTFLLEENNYQSVMIMGLFSKLFSILPLKAANKVNHPNIIVSPRGMLAEGALKIKASKKKMFLSWANLTGMYRSVNFHVTNEVEAKQVKKNIRKFHSIVVADNFPRKSRADISLESKKSVNTLKLVSIARIAPEKNTLFALVILASCQSNISFDLYGSIYDKDYWKECELVIKKLPPNIKVHYKGDLTANLIFDILPNYDFLFLPTRGENFGHIILESLMCGVPVIISDKTPWKDLDSKHLGFDVPLEDNKAFINVLEKVSSWDEQLHLEWKKTSLEYGKSKSEVSELKEKYIQLL